jgi:trans-AT polyketide synthase, acyltransferase and oxidoreductase domains
MAITSSSLESLGWWTPGAASPTTDPDTARDLLGSLANTVMIVHGSMGPAVAFGGQAVLGGSKPISCLPLLALLLPVHPTQLGDSSFCETHGLVYPYMTGAMANGIASADIVEAMARVGMLGSFGAAGLSLERVSQAVERLQATCGDSPHCFNLIHSPNEPAHEAALAELFLNRGVRLIEASAYLDLTLPIVRYRVAGLETGERGTTQIRNRVIAKVSRVEVASKFLAPPPPRMVQELLKLGQITPTQAELATTVPMCDDLTAEADSGGHTDNRPAITLLPTMLALRDRFQAQYQFPNRVRVGLAGGLATPAGVAAAFAMGAAYVVTGSVNQACLESGSSPPVRKMLADAGQADVTMAPAADMFEMGVKVQVLKRGTMFPMRGAKLFELYRQYPSWDAIPAGERQNVEKNILRASYDEIWQQTRDFFQRRDPTQLPKAESDPKHQMALVFRWYLGLSSRWANFGDATRQLDYQVWCGPAMGAFNEWTKGTFLEDPQNRSVGVVALNLLYGACIHLRKHQLNQQSVHLPDSWFPDCPVPLEELLRRLA